MKKATGFIIQVMALTAIHNLLALVCHFSSSAQAQNKYIEISPAALIQEYDRNEVAADEKYKNKILLISGKIHDIGKDFMDNMYIIMKIDEDSWDGVHIYINKSEKRKVVLLNKGQIITVKGRCGGKMLGSVNINNASVVENMNDDTSKNVDSAIKTSCKTKNGHREGKQGPIWTDRNTCKTWQNPPAGEKMQWQVAIDYCKNLNLGGYSDWHLPDKQELESILTKGQTNSHGCYWLEGLTGTCSWYWSSSSSENNASYAWFVYFVNGSTNNSGKSDSGAVRCVR